MAILLATLLFLIAGYYSKSAVNEAFPYDYLTFHNETGFTDDCWVDNFLKKDVCKNQGFCNTVNTDGSGTSCNCFYGYSGDYCEVFLKILLCAETDCGFHGIQGQCVIETGGWATCYCNPGWGGDNCSLEIEVDACKCVKCNNKGSCSGSSEGVWTCICEDGWGGESCEVYLDGCSSQFLLDIFSRLAVASGDVLSAAECGLSKPLVYSDSKGATSNIAKFPFCICSELWVDFLNEDYLHMLNTCTMDDYRKLPFWKESMSYCPNCDIDQDAIMENVLTSKSDTCYHFVYKRGDMPLYWRSTWKCMCVEDIGSRGTTQTIVTCPFKRHTAVNDYISYENCVSNKVCDWLEMYRYFEEELSFTDLEASAMCKDWMESWIFTVPGEQRFEEMDSTFCPCLDRLKGTGEELETILNCIPVTFHQLTMLELYNQICYDPLVGNADCLQSIGYVAVQLAVTNYTAASSCYSAIELSSSLTTLSDNLKDLMCDCIVPLYSSAIPIDKTVADAVACVGDEFALNVCDCPNYIGRTCHTIPSSISYNVEVEFDSYVHTSKPWTLFALIEITLFCSFSILAYFLRRRKRRINPNISI